jgi:choline kinase
MNIKQLKNKIGFQIGFLLYSGMSQEDAIKHLTEIAIDYAKIHVSEALKQASEKVTMKLRNDVHELDTNDDWMEVDKNSIINAYSLDDVAQIDR